MLPVLLAAFVGAAIGMVRRPLGNHLPDPVVVVPAAGIGGAGLQLVAGWFGQPTSGMLLGVSLALLCAFAVVNRHLVGMGVLAIGLAANAAVVVANGAMPVRASALVGAGVVEAGQLVDADLGAGRRFAQDGDLLPVLGDIVPVRAMGTVVSFGDLIALMGVGAVSGDLARLARRRVLGGREPARPRLTHPVYAPLRRSLSG